MKNRLLILLLLALALPAALAEAEIVSAPVELEVGEADEAELWAEAEADPQVAEVAPVSTNLCDRAGFAAWYEGAKARAAGADHLLGPDGDINTNPVTVILPGESIAVLPSYGLDKDGEYSIQGGIMAFGFTIYQLDGERAETESYGVNLLPRSPLPKSTKLTETAWETMPVPYAARIGLDEVDDGSIIDYHYTSRYVNNTGLPIMLLSTELGEWTTAGKMLGMGGNYTTYSFQGRGEIYHKPTFYFLENAYQVMLDTDTVLISSGDEDPESGKGLVWPNGEPQATISLPVDGKAHTFELPSPIRKGYHFSGWWPKDLYNLSSWRWGYLGFPGGTTQDDAPYDCCSSVMTEGKTTVTINLTKSIQKYEDFAQRGCNLHDYVLAPMFEMAWSEHDSLTLGFNPEGGTIYGKDYYFCETKGISNKFSVDITKIVPVREGYTFKGWCTDPKDPVNSLIDDPSAAGAYYWAKQGHTELYATWSANAAKKSVKGAKVTVKAATWTGNAVKPTVTVKLNGKALKKDTDFTATYTNNKKVGKGTVTITGKGSYTGSVKATFKINPAKRTGLKLTAGKKQLTAKWTKAKDGAGYQIQYGLLKSFKKAKTVTITKNATVKTVLKKLTSGKIYYVRIRGYKKIGTVAYTSAWSKAKSVKVK